MSMFGREYGRTYVVQPVSNQPDSVTLVTNKHQYRKHKGLMSVVLLYFISEENLFKVGIQTEVARIDLHR